MQLRKRKRVDYSYQKNEKSPENIHKLEVSKQPSSISHDIQIHSGINIILDQDEISSNTISKIPLNNSSIKNKTLKDKSILERKIPHMKLTSLERPQYRSSEDFSEDLNSVESIDQLQNKYLALDKLIDTQYGLYYKDLTGPKYLGPKNFESLRLPSDITNLRDISEGVKRLIQLKTDLETYEFEKAIMTPEELINQIPTYHSTINESNKKDLLNLKNIQIFSKDDLISRIAKIHNIDIRDIKEIKDIKYSKSINKQLLDTNFININEVKSISRKLDKPLLKERNTTLGWPMRVKKKKKQGEKKHDERGQSNSKYNNVPLYNSV